MIDELSVKLVTQYIAPLNMKEIQYMLHPDNMPLVNVGRMSDDTIKEIKNTKGEN